MKRAIAIGLACGWLMATVGCCCGVGAGCGGGCGPCIAGGCGPCAEGCDDDCGQPACDSCGPCGGHCFTPLTPFLFVLRVLGCSMPCGGCDNEIYWGDFYSHPPYCHEPCDCQGNWTGGGCRAQWGGCGCGDCGAGPASPTPTPDPAVPYGMRRSATSPTEAVVRTRTMPSRPYATGPTQSAPSRSAAPSTYVRTNPNSAQPAVPPPKLISVTDRVVSPLEPAKAASPKAVSQASRPQPPVPEVVTTEEAAPAAEATATGRWEPSKTRR